MKNEEIKEILHLLKRCDNTYLKIENSNGEKEHEYHQVNDLRLDGYHSQLLLDYITNIQQDLEKANDIIKKDRQFYKCRMDEYAELKKENEDLKNRLENKLTPEELVNMLNQELVRQNKCYKSRCEKAAEYIKEHWVIDEPIKFKNDLLNILNGENND